jgi:hypothetical protein
VTSAQKGSVILAIELLARALADDDLTAVALAQKQLAATIPRHYDAALVLSTDDPREALVEQVIQSILTEVMVEVGGVKMHLAAWMDPDHWADDWRKAGVDDVDVFVASALEEEG